jgi:hypothetical protein
MLRIPEDRKETVREAVRRSFGEGDGNEVIKELYDALCFEVTEQTVGGKPLIIITLHLGDDTIEDALTVMDENLGLGEALGLSESNPVESLRAMLRDIEDIDGEIKISIEKYGGKLHGATADVCFVSNFKRPKMSDATFRAELTVDDSEISVVTSLDVDFATPIVYGWELVFSREGSGDAVNYSVACSESTETYTTFIRKRVFDVNVEYDKKDSEILIEVEDHGTGLEMSVGGELDVGRDKITLTFDEIGSDGVSIDPNLKITVRGNDNLPKAPEYAVEFIELDEDGIKEFMKRLRENSALYK